MNKFSMLSVCVVCMLISCSTGYQQFVSDYSLKSVDGKPDYSSLDYWAAHPYKKDPSDSLPKSLVKNYQADSSADVFFIYPTSYTDADYALGYNAPIDDAAINAKTDYGSILYQASVFNAAGRVFAPRYRQANYWCYFPKDSAAALAAFQLAYEDVKTAFEYYLAHYNKGRPIIIASHSQGATHGITLLKEFFDIKPLQKQLVAAYLVGMPVRPDYYTTLKPCSSPEETGCICSWRTMRKDYLTPFAESETYTAIVTNPITWKASVPDAPHSSNPGSVLRNFKKLKKHVANASVHGGVLWINKPKFFGSFFLRKIKNYHIADYNFYYLSVRRNAMQRVQSFLKKSSAGKTVSY